MNLFVFLFFEPLNPFGPMVDSSNMLCVLTKGRYTKKDLRRMAQPGIKSEHLERKFTKCTTERGADVFARKEPFCVSPNKPMANTHKFTLPTIVLLILIENDRVLLMRRRKTGWLDGSYDLVAGHIDGQETLSSALQREALEEIGITLDPHSINFAHLLHYVGSTEYMYAFFTTSTWVGSPKIREPSKCDDLQWFPLSELPKNTAPITRGVLAKFLKGETYTEFTEK